MSLLEISGQYDSAYTMPDNEELKIIPETLFFTPEQGDTLTGVGLPDDDGIRMMLLLRRVSEGRFAGGWIEQDLNESIVNHGPVEFSGDGDRLFGFWQSSGDVFGSKRDFGTWVLIKAVH